MFKAFLSCMGMFTKLPFPMVEWEEKKGPAALCFLPSAGLFCGMATTLVYYGAAYFNIADDIGAVLLLFSLYIVSGFVHVDGFMDTVDSLLSARDKEGKIAILKDSKVGAFSVIAVCLLLISLYASLKTLLSYNINPCFFLLISMLSRANAAFMLFTFKPLSSKGLLFYFRDGEKPIHKILMIMAGIILLSLLLILGINFLISALIASVLSIGLVLSAQKQLDGINGDIIGASIIIMEAVSYLILSMII